jgi:diguanylate cyclase (GGDEF)-like protein
MMQIENSLLRRDSAVDPLSGLFNRRYLDQVLDREIEFAERDQHPVSVIILDLDHFKTINDEHGHAAGDAVLSGVADVLRSRLRIYDVPCRYGGDELVVIAPGAGAAEAEVIAEALRLQIAETPFSDGARELPCVTASFGIAVYPGHGKTTEDLLRAADGALYAAKAAGRNRVSVVGKPLVTLVKPVCR